MIFWVIGTFYLLMLLGVLVRAAFSGSGSSHSSSGWWEQAKCEHRENNMKDLENMLTRTLKENQEVTYSYFDAETGKYYVDITWKIYGKKFGKTLETFTLRGMENEIRKLP